MTTDRRQSDPWAQAPLPTSLEVQPRQFPILIILEGPGKNQRFTLDKHDALIGRDMFADIVVKDSKSSRHHARIVYANIENKAGTPDCRIFDEGSLNGTLVNGETVGPEGTALNDKDRIQIGRTLLGFFVAGTVSLEQKIEEMAVHDPLTGLFNRAIFNRVLGREVGRAERYDRALSLILLDIDRLRRVNEEHGVAGGDAVLKQLGGLLCRRLRAHDFVARFADGQIAILLPETNLGGARVLADRVCGLVATQTFSYQEKPIRITVSAGFASLNESDSTSAGLLDVVQRALTRAKNLGGNQAAELNPPQIDGA